MPNKAMPQMAFRLPAENKQYYAESIKPVEYNYNYKYIPAKPIVIPVKNTKYILALKSRGGGL
jgi:hypothetical protein